ncbi:MAG: hypothetical protein AAGD28_20835 [Bacteroidota bacterium]
MRYVLLIVGLFILSGSSQGQDWERRHKFAKAYFGISNFFVPQLSAGQFLNTGGNIEEFDRSGFLSPSVNIGATHFWGYADLYVSINTVGLKFKKDVLENSIRLGTFTGLRVYPWPSKSGNIRPYLGYKFSPFRFRQNDISDQSYKFTQVKSAFDLGLGIQLPNFYFTLEYSRVANPSFNTFLSRDRTSTSKFPSQLFQLGFNYMIETTASSNTGALEELTRIFSSSNKDGFFVAGGPSSAFPLLSSDYISDLYPFLDDKSFPRIFPDLAVGYHFTKTDIITALSFRPMSQRRSAFDFDQQINRRSLILEAYKFVGDYHGFVPYFGLGLSYENLSLTEMDGENMITDLTQNKVSPAFVFGWDIRPSVKADWWILRTNLRYYPFLNIEHQERNLSLQHLEFNFIQFVFYPQRKAKYRNR